MYHLLTPVWVIHFFIRGEAHTRGLCIATLGRVLCMSLIVVTVGKYFVTRGTKQQHFYIIFGHCVRLSLTGATLPFTKKLFKADTPRLI